MFSALHWAVLFAAFGLPVTDAFSFQTTNPSQCQDMTITWTGGKAPFNLLILPVYGVQSTVSIPSSAVQGGKGSFDWTVYLKSGSSFLVSMSDATGYGTGGISSMLSVGDNGGTAGCNMTGPPIDFFFSEDPSIQQCGEYSFYEYENATQPVTIYGFEPDGALTTYNVPKGVSNFTTKAAVRAGHSTIYCMYDARGRVGGCSNVYVVKPSNDDSCLPPSTTGNGTSSSGSSNGNNGKKSKSGLSGGVYAAIGVGAVLGLVGIGALILFCMKRRRRQEDHHTSGRKEGDFGVTYDPVPLHPADNYAPNNYTPNNYTPYDPYNTNSRVHSFVTPSRLGKEPESIGPAGFNEQPSKNRASRVVVHTDIAEAPRDEIVELPPHYSDGRAPIAGLENTPAQPNYKQTRLITLTPTDAV